MKYYICKHFKLYDLVPRELYRQKGTKCWQFLDSRLLYSIDQVRNHFKLPLIINNWHRKTLDVSNKDEIFKILKKDSVYQYRCFRPPWVKFGSPLGQHKMGRAATFTILGISSDEIRKELLDHQKNNEFRYITFLEGTDLNVSIDVRQTGSENMILSNFINKEEKINGRKNLESLFKSGSLQGLDKKVN